MCARKLQNASVSRFCHIGITMNDNGFGGAMQGPFGFEMSIYVGHSTRTTDDTRQYHALSREKVQFFENNSEHGGNNPTGTSAQQNATTTKLRGLHCRQYLAQRRRRTACCDKSRLHRSDTFSASIRLSRHAARDKMVTCFTNSYKNTCTLSSV